MHLAVGDGSGDAGRMGFGRNTPQKFVWRSRIVLLSADRVGVMAIGRAVGKSKVTVSRWQERYLAQGPGGLRRDATRSARKPPLTGEAIKHVLGKTLHEKPAAGTRGSSRKMAAACGLSYTSVQRIWQAHKLKPHLMKTFKLSNDKRFAVPPETPGHASSHSGSTARIVADDDRG